MCGKEDGRSEFTITMSDGTGVEDMSPWVLVSNVAAELMRRCVRGHADRRGGVATGLGEWSFSLKHLESYLSPYPSFLTDVPVHRLRRVN